MVVDRNYVVPLRKGFRETANYKKTKKAVAVLKQFLAQHMKSDLEKVKIGKNLNKELWKHGIKNPPHHVRVHAIKEDDGTVKAELIGFNYEHKKKEQKEKEQETKEEVKEESKKEKVERSAQEKSSAQTVPKVEKKAVKKPKN
jgi:large subunit ribosomal protein L31e